MSDLNVKELLKLQSEARQTRDARYMDNAKKYLDRLQSAAEVAFKIIRPHITHDLIAQAIRENLTYVKVYEWEYVVDTSKTDYSYAVNGNEEDRVYLLDLVRTHNIAHTNTRGILLTMLEDDINEGNPDQNNRLRVYYRTTSNRDEKPLRFGIFVGWGASKRSLQPATDKPVNTSSGRRPPRRRDGYGRNGSGWTNRSERSERGDHRGMSSYNRDQQTSQSQSQTQLAPQPVSAPATTASTTRSKKSSTK